MMRPYRAFNIMMTDYKWEKTKKLIETLVEVIAGRYALNWNAEKYRMLSRYFCVLSCFRCSVRINNVNTR